MPSGIHYGTKCLSSGGAYFFGHQPTIKIIREGKWKTVICPTRKAAPAMTHESLPLLRNPIPYTAAFTREQFLFYETRATARLISEGLSEEEAVNRIIEENLFQYPTEKSVRRMAKACVRRLKAMEDETLVRALASEPSQTAKQICLYAMMRQYRVVWDFMVTVIGEKYRLRDTSFGKMDLNVFFIHLQEQDDNAASWSDSTVIKLKQVLTKILVENGYIDSGKAGHLNPVWLDPILENAIRGSGDHRALAAFNCFS